VVHFFGKRIDDRKQFLANSVYDAPRTADAVAAAA